jgi:hypothetical protein
MTWKPELNKGVMLQRCFISFEEILGGCRSLVSGGFKRRRRTPWSRLF